MANNNTDECNNEIRAICLILNWFNSTVYCIDFIKINTLHVNNLNDLDQSQFNCAILYGNCS